MIDRQQGRVVSHTHHTVLCVSNANLFKAKIKHYSTRVKFRLLCEFDVMEYF